MEELILMPQRINEWSIERARLSKHFLSDNMKYRWKTAQLTTDIKAHTSRWTAISHARRRQQGYNLTDESNSSVLIHQFQSPVAQSTLAGNNQSDGVNSSSSGEPVVVKTRSRRVVVPPVGTVNRINWINRPCIGGSHAGTVYDADCTGPKCFADVRHCTLVQTCNFNLLFLLFF